MMGNRALIAAMAALCFASCTTEPAAPVDESMSATTESLDDQFATAAQTYGVPVDLLKAIAYVETGWQHAVPEDEGTTDEMGRPVAFGVFGLRDENLVRGAAAAGLDVETVRMDNRANITAAAARLDDLADAAQLESAARSDLSAWTPVVAQFAQIAEDDARSAYLDDVQRVLATGAESIAEDGRVIARLQPRVDVDITQVGVPYSGGGDFADAIWRPSPNYSARTSAPTMVVIHTCEGAYSGCWGWLKNSGSGVSAHYVVNENGGEVTQLVREGSKAWHVSANYDCARAGSTQCSKNGQGVNNFAVGIEHAGFGSQTSWSQGLIEKSAQLTCDITRRHNIPRDKNHIIAHGQLQPWNRSDPGKAWPWDHYISRVRAYCGDSGTTPPSNEIIVDSNNANNNPSVSRIELAGSWTSSTSKAGYYGSGYWVANTAEVSQPATFWFYLPQAGTRTVDAWWTTATNRATGAPFIAFNANDVEVGRKVVNQQTTGSSWVTLGTWTFSAGWNKVVLSRWATPDTVVVADAVRVR